MKISKRIINKLRSLIFTVPRNQYLVDSLIRKDPRFAKYSIGDFSYGIPQILFPNENATLKIGRYVSIANDVIIMLGGEHRPDWVSTYPLNIMYPEFNHIKGHPTTKGSVIIGSDVWIGRQALIMSGVTIGDGAIIAANAVVVKNVEPYSIVGGNPAKHIRYRFSGDEIAELLRIQWWNWPDEEVRKLTASFMSTDVSSIVAYYENHIKNIAAVTSK